MAEPVPPRRPSLLARCRHRTQSTGTEAGFTLIELSVAMVIGALVLALVLSSMVTALQTGVNTVAAGQANDKASLALDLLQRQVVAANVIYNPATATPDVGPTVPAGFALRMYTTYKGTPTCVQWRLKTTGNLQYRTWRAGNTASVGYWYTIATGLVATGAAAPFSLGTSSAYANRVLSVTLTLQASAGKASSAQHTVIESSFPALDAEFYAATSPQFCTPPAAATPSP